MFCYMTLYSPISVHAFISEKCPWVLPIIYLEAFPTFSTQIYQTRHTILGSNHTIQTEALCSRIFCPQRLDEQEGRTDRHQAPVQEGGFENRSERSRAAYLVADGLILEPWLVQNLLQLLVVKVGHPDGFGQPCVLAFLQGLGGRGGEKLRGMTEQE